MTSLRQYAVGTVERHDKPPGMAHGRRPGMVALSSLLSGVLFLGASSASAATNQFRGVNWADARDNFQAGVLYVSGLSSSDTYATASATGTAVMQQFVSKLGANAVRLPINEATVSEYWDTYTGAIDAVLSEGMVVFCYWDSAKTNKPPDMNAFWAMWKTVVDKYGGNENTYFEVFNEPNMYSKDDLISLYGSWLTQFPDIPTNRVILDGTGDAQNVPDIGSASALSGCLLAVHEYSFFGSDSWNSESQWVSQFKSEVGDYADRTVCTEWGGPMSPGSKNGVSYGSLDYGQAPTNYFEAYLRGVSSQLRASSMGSFYWPGLRDGDWYSMTTRSGTGSNLVLSVPNESGLTQLQNAWTGPAPIGGAGGRGNGGNGGSEAGSGGQNHGGAGRGSGAAGAAVAGSSGSGGASVGGRSNAGGAPDVSGVGGAGREVGGRGASGGTTSGNAGAGAGPLATGGTVSENGGATMAAGSGGAGGSTGASSGNGGRGGDSASGASAASGASPGCSCAIERDRHRVGAGLTLLLGGVILSLVGERRRRRNRTRPGAARVRP